jgi:DNA-binding IclR family transcriptional regulator
MQAEDGALLLVGTVNDAQRRAWQALCEAGRCAADDLATVLGEAPSYAAALLTTLHERRLIMRFDDTYVPLGAAQ